MSGSYDRRVRLIDASTGKCDRTIQGHAGSIRCVYVSEERGIVLSGGYDTSIRYILISNNLESVIIGLQCVQRVR